EVIFEITEFVARLAVNEQDLELFLANRDNPFDSVVIDLELAGTGLDLNHKGALPGLVLRGSMDELDAVGMAIARGLDLLGIEHTVGPGFFRLALLPLELDLELLPLKTMRRQFHLEPHGILDEDHIVDQELGEFQIARGLGASQSNGVKWHALA